MAFQDSKVDQVIRLRKGNRHIILHLSKRIGRAPVKWQWREDRPHSTGTTVVIKVVNVRELGVQHVPHKTWKVPGWISETDIGLVNADGINKVPEQSEQHLRRVVD